MASLNPAIWVVGDIAVGKHTLAQSIAGLQCDRSKSYSWQIDTKYYTVDVDLHAFRFSQQHPDADAPEAVVIVIDATDEKTFLAAKSWSAAGSWAAAEIKILAANKVDELLGKQGDLTRSAWLLEAMEWCTENLCEYVEVCCGVPSKDAGLTLDSEQQGVARVVSALQAHMWPGMTRKAVQHAVHHMQSEDEEEEVRGEQQQQQQPPPPATAASPSAAEPGPTSKVQAGEAAAAAAAVHTGEAKGDEEDGKVDAFEKLLAELQGSRERIAGLPDDKRRQAAAELAMRVAMLLDDGDDSDPVDDTDYELLRDT